MKFKDKTWYPIVYMFLVTIFFSGILLVFGSFTRSRVENNRQLFFERAVLESMPLELPKALPPAQIHKLYLHYIKDSTEYTAGALRYFQNDSFIAYALPIQGPGFWAPIKGIIGIARNRRTITGISFYEQNETPGLGGEIIKEDFRQQFSGKILASDAPLLEIKMANEPLDENSVHAVTGATQTSMRLGEFMNRELTRWQARIEESIKP